MLLVPRQLQRAGMTGTVPYYGGRFTPAQAYAVSHPQSGPPAPVPPASPAVAVHTPVPSPKAPGRISAAPQSREDTQETLRQLLDSGVITAAEYEELRSRVRP